MDILVSLIFILIVGYIVYNLIRKNIISKNRANAFNLTIQGTDFNPVYAYPNTKAPQLAIDPDKRMFYIAGRTPKVFHASEMINIGKKTYTTTKPFSNMTLIVHELSITTTDLDESVRYVYCENTYQLDQWYGRIQAVWNM